LIDAEDRGALQDAFWKVIEVGSRDQCLWPGLQRRQQTFASGRVELGHYIIEQEHGLLAGDLRQIVQLGQLQAQHGTPLLPLAGEEPGLVVIEPHLDIVAVCPRPISSSRASRMATLSCSLTSSCGASPI